MRLAVRPPGCRSRATCSNRSAAGSSSATPGSPPGTRNWPARSTRCSMPGASGCSRKSSPARNAARPQLKECLEFLHPDDALVVLELSRLGRSLQDLITIVGGLRRRGIGFISLHENLDTTTPGRPPGVPCLRRAGRVHPRTHRRRHPRRPRRRPSPRRASGRPPAMTEQQVRQARALLTELEATISSIAGYWASPAPPSTSTYPNSPAAAAVMQGAKTTTPPPPPPPPPPGPPPTATPPPPRPPAGVRRAAPPSTPPSRRAP